MWPSAARPRIASVSCASMSTSASGRTRSMRESCGTSLPEPEHGDHADADQLGRAPAHLADVAERGLGVARHEERREQRDDEQVEQDRPADEEAGGVAEGAPHDQRRAAAGRRARPRRRRRRRARRAGRRPAGRSASGRARTARRRRARSRATRRSCRRSPRRARPRRRRAGARGACGPLARASPICSASQPRPRPASVSAAPKM